MMRTRKGGRWVGLIILVSLLLGGCAGTSPAAEAPEAAQAGTGMFFSANLARTGVYEGEDVAQPGAPAWQFQAGDWIFTAPAIVDDTVYFGSYDGNVYAVAAADGRELWRFATEDIVISSPAVVGSRLYFGGYDGVLYALDRATGEELWRLQTGGPISGSPAVAADKVVAGSEDGVLYAVDAASGEVIWRADFASPLVFETAVVDGKVYAASSDGVLGVLDLDSGELLWQFDLPAGSTMGAGPVVAGEAIYVLANSPNLVGVLYAIDIPERAERWNMKLPAEAYASPAVHGDLVFVAAMDGVLRAVEVNTGKERWGVETAAPIFSSPAIAGHSLYFGSWGGRALYSVDVRNGRVQWQYPLGSGVSSPAVSGDTVYVGTEDGKMSALR